MPVNRPISVPGEPVHIQANRLARLLGYLTQDAANLHLLHEAANCAIQQGEWQQASELVARALALDPTDALSRYHQSVLLARMGRGEESLALTQGLLDEGRRNDAILFQHACNLVLVGRHSDAEPMLSALAPSIGHLAGFTGFHLRALHGAGKLDEAKALARASGDDPVLQGMLSLVLVDADELEQGRALAQSVLVQNPANIDALLADGTVALSQQESAIALSRFEQVVSTQAHDGRAWLGIGLAKLFAQDLPGAREALEQAVRFMPGHLGAWNALAWLLLLQDELEAAGHAIHSALAIDRNFGESHGTLAVLQLLRQDWATAEQEINLGLRLQPDSFSAAFARALLLEHRGHPEKARQLVRQLREDLASRTGRSLADTLRAYLGKKTNAARTGRGKPGGKAP